MADGTQGFDTVTIPELDDFKLALTSFFATSNLNGKLGKATVQELVVFIAPYVQGIASSGFIATLGTVLPTPGAGKFTFVGAGTFTQTTGGNIVTTQLLNILVANGTSWSLYAAIPIIIPTQKTPVWAAQIYAANSQVIYLGKQWSNATATIATDIPGTSSKWTEDLTAYSALPFSVGKVYFAGQRLLNANNEPIVAVKNTSSTDDLSTIGSFMKEAEVSQNYYSFEANYRQ